MFRDKSLNKIYDICNKKYFNNRLSRKGVTVEWSNRMTSVAGQHEWVQFGNNIYTKRIALSKPYHKEYKGEIRNTLVHEMVHQLYPRDKHGPKFQKEVKKLNKFPELDIKTYSKGRAVVNYVYGCQECGNEWKRSNRMNTKRYSCQCGGKIILKINNKNK